MLHTVRIMLLRNPPGMAGIGTNVRLHQVRLWLCTAYVKAADDDSNRRILKVDLCHTGNETIQKSDDVVFCFAHASINISFRYYCGLIHSLQDAKAVLRDVRQVI